MHTPHAQLLHMWKVYSVHVSAQPVNPPNRSENYAAVAVKYQIGLRRFFQRRFPGDVIYSRQPRHGSETNMIQK